MFAMEVWGPGATLTHDRGACCDRARIPPRRVAGVPAENPIRVTYGRAYGNEATDGRISHPAAARHPVMVRVASVA